MEAKTVDATPADPRDRHEANHSRVLERSRMIVMSSFAS